MTEPVYLDAALHEEAQRYYATLNGYKVNNCLAAHVEEGWIEVLLPGNLFQTDDNGSVRRQTYRERVFGEVELVPVDAVA